MTITNVNNRPDWFMATHTTPSGKIYHETAHNRHTAIALLFLKVKTMKENKSIAELANPFTSPSNI
jgi:hypothetical protein